LAQAALYAAAVAAMSFDGGPAPRVDSKNSLETDQEEEERLKKIFRQMDQDGSGAIDVKELADAMRLVGVKCTANSAKKVLKVIDTDGSGEIELDEFLVFFKKVKDPDEIKNLLASTNQKFMDYKTMVQSDPSFMKKFIKPPEYNCIATYDGHADNVECVCWMDAPNVFLTASLDGSIKWWEAEFDPDAKGMSKVKSNKAMKTVEVTTKGIYACQISSDKKFAAIATGATSDNILWWDLSASDASTGVVMTHTGHDSEPFAVAVSPDMKFIGSGGKNGKICIHKVGQEKPTWSETKHEKVLCGVAFSPDSKKFMTASYDGMVYIYGLNEGVNCYIDGTIPDAAATEMVFGGIWYDNTDLFTVGDDFCCKRWDPRKKDRDGTVASKTNFFGCTNATSVCALSPKFGDGKVHPAGKFLITGTNDGSARIWNVEEKSMMEDQLKWHNGICAWLEADKFDEEEKEDMADAFVLKEVMARLQVLSADRGFLKEAKKERDDMDCLQARVCLCGHKLGIKSLDMRFIDETTCEVLTGASDQSCKLFRFEVPDTKTYIKWANMAKDQEKAMGRRPSKGSVASKDSKMMEDPGDQRSTMTLQITPEEIARSRAGTAPKRKPSKKMPSKEGVTSPPPEEAPKAE